MAYRRLVNACWLCLIVSGCGRASPPQLDFEWSLDDSSTVLVHGLDPTDLAALAQWAPEADAWQDLMRVQVGTIVDQPAIVGSYHLVENGIKFRPRFPFDKTGEYVVQFDRSRLPRTGHRYSELPATVRHCRFTHEAQPAASVSCIFPSADTLPENQLKFYIHFSQPMSRGEAYRRVCLLDGVGRPIASAFLEIGEELWNSDQTRFTLFIDPGRIKHGLRPHLDLGPVFEAGKTYTLVVDRDWRDATGRTLQSEYRKTFRTTAADEQSPDPAQWKVESPAAGTRQPLAVSSSEPLDHALLLRVLSVVDESGQPVVGAPTTSEHETRWEFTPQEPWSPGAYRLVVATTLEDLAGNRIGRRFEVDEFEPITQRVPANTISVPFQIGSGQ